jgi:fructokinase
VIVGIGELLWDVFPDGRKVAGGAPFNFAFHCHRLGHPAAVVSRVGDDELGRELRDEVRRLGLTDEYIQTDREHPTGTVRVTVDAAGQPSYEIVEDVAWDYIGWDDQLQALAGRCRAVCFGTLAQRSESADAIQGFLSDSRLGDAGYALRMFDVNLRQHYYSAVTLRSSLYRSAFVKVSEEELPAVTATLGFSGETTAERVAALFRYSSAETRHIYVSRGSAGVDLYYEREPAPIHEPAAPARVVDTVGAGDAFTAAMVCMHLEGRWGREAARFASHYAARVCERRGATPRIDRADVERAAGM